MRLAPILIAACAALAAACSAEPSANTHPSNAPTTTATTSTTTTTVPPTTTTTTSVPSTPRDKVNVAAVEALINLPTGEASVGDMVVATCELLDGTPPNDAAYQFALLLTADPNYLPTISSLPLDPDRLAGHRLGVPIACPQHQATLDRAIAGDTGPVEPITTIGSGTHDVGDKPGLLLPGTYRTRDVSDCYWERTARNGDILDNQFATRAQEITVTIRASDGSFTSEGCGGWERIG